MRAEFRPGSLLDTQSGKPRPFDRMPPTQQLYRCVYVAEFDENGGGDRYEGPNGHNQAGHRPSPITIGDRGNAVARLVVDAGVLGIRHKQSLPGGGHRTVFHAAASPRASVARGTPPYVRRRGGEWHHLAGLRAIVAPTFKRHELSFALQSIRKLDKSVANARNDACMSHQCVSLNIRDRVLMPVRLEGWRPGIALEETLKLTSRACPVESPTHQAWRSPVPWADRRRW